MRKSGFWRKSDIAILALKFVTDPDFRTVLELEAREVPIC